MDKFRILSGVVGVIMIVSIIKPLIASILLGCLGAGLWLKGEDILG